MSAPLFGRPPPHTTGGDDGAPPAPRANVETQPHVVWLRRTAKPNTNAAAAARCISSSRSPWAVVSRRHTLSYAVGVFPATLSLDPGGGLARERVETHPLLVTPLNPHAGSRTFARRAFYCDYFPQPSARTRANPCPYRRSIARLLQRALDR